MIAGGMGDPANPGKVTSAPTRNRFSPCHYDVVDDLVRALSARQVVHHNRGILSCKMPCDCYSDAF